MIVYRGTISVAKWVTRGYISFFVLLACTIYAAQGLELQLPRWAAHYLNDFLCMPIVLFICRSVVRILRSNNSLQLPFPLILLLTLYFAVYFEYYLPRVNARYTADAWDVVLYFSGSAFFYLMEGRSFIADK